MALAKRKRDGEFETPVDETLRKVANASKNKKKDKKFLSAKEEVRLSKNGLITFDEKKGWCLTKKGKRRANMLENNERAYEILFNSLLMEASNHNSLLLLDIDDTLVTASNIYIYKKSRNGKEIALTPQEFAEENTAEEKEKGFTYDFREFRDPEKVANSIKTGLPIVSNLKKMDNYIKNGWTIGVLTARGMEDVIAKTMKEWLKYRDAKGNLKSAARKLARNLVFAVSDDSKGYKKPTSFKRKAEVIRNLASQYDRVFLLDDDESNLEAVNDLGIKNVKAMKAKKQ